MKFILGILLAHAGYFFGEAARLPHQMPLKESSLLESLLQRSPSSTYEIPVFSDGVYNYVKMLIGNPQRTLYLFPSANMYEILVVSYEGTPYVNDYGEMRGYSIAKSQTFHLLNEGKLAEALGVDFVGQEDIQVGNLSLKSVNFCTVGRSNLKDLDGVPINYDGFFGLGPPRRDEFLLPAVFLNAMKRLLSPSQSLKYIFRWNRKPSANGEVGKLAMELSGGESPGLVLQSEGKDCWFFTMRNMKMGLQKLCKKECSGGFSFKNIGIVLNGEAHQKFAQQIKMANMTDRFMKVESKTSANDVCEVLIESDSKLPEGDLYLGTIFLKKYPTYFMPIQQKIIVQKLNP